MTPDLTAAAAWFLCLWDDDRAGADEIADATPDPGALLAGVVELAESGEGADPAQLRALLGLGG